MVLEKMFTNGLNPVYLTDYDRHQIVQIGNIHQVQQLLAEL